MIELPLPDLDVEEIEAVGVVLDAGRGTLPYALVHGEPLVACAAWSLGEAGVQLLDLGTPWARLAAEDRCLVLHDALCPLAPPAFLAACVQAAEEHDAVVVAARPVTDTVKEIGHGGVVGDVVDRDRLLAVASPLVLPPRVLALMADPDLDAGPELADLLALLARTEEVLVVAAPPTARRVHDLDDLRLLEALDPR